MQMLVVLRIQVYTVLRIWVFSCLMQPYRSPIMLTGGRDSRLDDPLSPTSEHWNSTRNRCLKGRTILTTWQILSFDFQRCAGENLNCRASRREAWPR